MVKAAAYVSAKYLSAKTAGEYNNKTFVIDSAFNSEIGQQGSEQDKLCIRLKGIDKPLALNQTNLTILMVAYGDDTDSWINKKVILHIVSVPFNGQVVQGLQLEATN
jgi:hypothetical protein